jgi:hypothetical protein
MVELPFDVLYLVVTEAGELPHPYAYTIDTATLHALCLVSRDFNALATPILYSSIRLSDHHGVLRLLATAESNPNLLQLCHSIYWPGDLKNKLLIMMSGLRRFSTLQRSCRALQCLPSENLVELSLPEIPFSELCWHCQWQFSRFVFTNLERLVVKSIWVPGHDSDHNSAIYSFDQMPRLAHLIVVEVVTLSHSQPGMVFDDFAAIIKHIPRSCRVVFGQGVSKYRTFDYGGFWRAISSLSECCNVILLTYNEYVKGKWFREHVVDGTLWEIDFETYRFELDSGIEVHPRSTYTYQ